MKTVFFESLRYKFITKNDFYYGSCPDIHISEKIVRVVRNRTAVPHDCYSRVILLSLNEANKSI